MIVKGGSIMGIRDWIIVSVLLISLIIWVFIEKTANYADELLRND